MLKNFKFRYCWVTEQNEIIIMPWFIWIIDVMCSEVPPTLLGESGADSEERRKEQRCETFLTEKEMTKMQYGRGLQNPRTHEQVEKGCLYALFASKKVIKKRSIKAFWNQVHNKQEDKGLLYNISQFSNSCKLGE